MPAEGHKRTGNPRGNPKWRALKAAREQAAAGTIEDSTRMQVTAGQALTEEEQVPDSISFEVEEAPNAAQASGLERAKQLAKQALNKAGFTTSDTSAAGSAGGKAAADAGGKLNKKQQNFVDAIQPMIVYALVISSAWVWSKKGTEYKALAPTDEMATKIVAPFVRIMARHSKGGGLSPDAMDMLAGFGAIAAYGRYVMLHYHEIREIAYQGVENEQPGTYYEQFNASTGTIDNYVPYEGGYTGRNDRRDYRRADAGTAESDGGSNGVPGTVNKSTLTERERQQYAKLRLLIDRDTASRARRAGRIRVVYKRAS